MIDLFKLNCKLAEERIVQIYVREFLNFIGIQHYIEYIDREKIEADGAVDSDRLENYIDLYNRSSKDIKEVLETVIDRVCESSDERKYANIIKNMFLDSDILRSIYYLRYLGNRKDLITQCKNCLRAITVELNNIDIDIDIDRNAAADYVSLNLMYYAILGAGEAKDRSSDICKQFENRAKNLQLLYGDNMYLDSLLIRYYICKKSNDTAKQYYMQHKKEFNYGMFSSLAYINKYYNISCSQILKLPVIKNPNDLKNFYISAYKAKENGENSVAINTCKQALKLIEPARQTQMLELEEIIFGMKYAEILAELEETCDYMEYCEALVSKGMIDGYNKIIAEIFKEDSLKVMADIVDNCPIIKIIRTYANKYKEERKFREAVELYNNALLRYGNTTLGLEKRAITNEIDA